MNGRDFLNTAKFLKNESDDEAGQRSAISRAYYACFLATRSITFENARPRSLGANGISREKLIGHDKLTQMLKGSHKEQVEILGEELGDMLGQRKKADYDMQDSTICTKVEDLIEDAERYLQQLDSVESSEIGGGASDYLDSIVPPRR